MRELVTDEDIARARRDPVFRQQLMVENLDRLLEALKYMRQANNQSPLTARQIREGVDLAVKLADKLQRNGTHPGPRAA